MKNLFSRIFAFAVLVFVLFQIQNLTAQTLAPFPGKYSFVSVSESEGNSNRNESINQVIIPSGIEEFVSASFLPIPLNGLSESIQNIGIRKNHFLMISFCLSAFFLVLSHKNRFETEIYEFYNRTSTGEIIFESDEMAKSHELKSYWAISLKILGLLCGFIAVALIIF